LTSYRGLDGSIPWAIQAEFGVGISHIDNWIAEEIDVWGDFTTGKLTTHFMTGRGSNFCCEKQSWC